MDEITKAVFTAKTRNNGRSIIIVIPQTILNLGFEDLTMYRFTIEKIPKNEE